MKTFLQTLFGVLFAFLILIFGSVFIISGMFSTAPLVPSSGYLQINLSGPIPDYRASDPWEESFGVEISDLRKIRDNLEKAAVDERVKAVVLRIAFLGVGFGKLNELQEMIQIFKASGKPIYAYLDFATTRDYYLASACDSIFMAPASNLYLTGLQSEVTFYRELFGKIGVEADFIQIGRYKNAPDVYTKNKITEPHREVLENLLDLEYNELTRRIAANRPGLTTPVDRLINDLTGLDAEEALGQNLIDQVISYDQFENFLQDSLGAKSKISAAEYSRIPASSLKIRNESGIAVVHLSGVISEGSDTDDPLYGALTGSESAIENLNAAAKAGSIKAIILRIDSPGGSAGASEQIWQAVQKAAKAKPLVVSIADYGASGGFYVTLGADSVFVNPLSLVGSIGIFAGKFSLGGLYEKIGLHTDVFSRGRNSGLFSASQSWSPTERAVIERLIRNFYEEFLNKTALARGLDKEEVRKLAEGRVWAGDEAVQQNLADVSGTFYDALEAARQLAGIDSSASVRLVYYPKQRNYWQDLIKHGISLTRSATGQGLLAQTGLESSLNQIQNKPMALMPCKISWK